MAKNNGDRFSWNKGDVQIYKNASDLKKAGVKIHKPKPLTKGKKKQG